MLYTRDSQGACVGKKKGDKPQNYLESPHFNFYKDCLPLRPLYLCPLRPKGTNKRHFFACGHVLSSPFKKQCWFALYFLSSILGSSINHVVKFLGIFAPSRSLLLNKAFVIKWSLGQSPSPQLSMWFMDAPFLILS